MEKFCISECLSHPAVNLVLAELDSHLREGERGTGLTQCLGLSKKCG